MIIMDKTPNKSAPFFLLFLISCCINAQVPITKNTKINYDVILDTANAKIDIKFNPQNPILNLLIVVSDSAGKTLFLDNQYRFSGAYKHTVDLNKYGKGVYFLNITNDSERFYQKLTIK